MSEQNADDFPFLTYLDGMVEDLRGLIPRVVKGDDVDAVHDARVATRRLKAAVELLDPLMGSRHRKPFAAVTRSLRKRLGPLRDLDVMLEHLGDVKTPRYQPAVQWMKERLTQARDKAVKKADDDLPPPRILAKLGTWWGLREEISAAKEAVGSVIGESVHLQLDAFAEQAGRLTTPAEPGAPRNDPHQLRIAGKSLRYTLELAKAHGRPLPKALMTSFKRIQEALGLWHDFVVLTERLMCESMDDMLAHHDAATQSAVLALASAMLRRAEQQLKKVAEFWKQDGEKLTNQIRESFPLIRAVAADAATVQADKVAEPAGSMA